jgi:DNA-binding transcriptional ArsR family regulator
MIMEDKITLDRESFKSLASETRVTILKSLDRRRKMLTELSKELKMSPSTVKEHMENLCAAGLTVQMDEGHKWKYYELTGKGKNVLHPEYTKIWILLSISVLAMIGIFADLFIRGSSVLAFASREVATGVGEMDKIAAPPAMESPMAQTVGEGAAQAIPYFHIIGLIIFAVILGSCVAYLVLSKKGRF